MKYRTTYINGNAYIVQEQEGRFLSVVARFENFQEGVLAEAGAPPFDQIVIDANKGAEQ